MVNSAPSPHELDAIRAEIDQLTRRLGELRDKLEPTPVALVPVTRFTDSRPTGSSAAEAESDEDPTRRRLFRRVGQAVAVGAAAAVGAPLLLGDPAAAATGDPVIQGNFNNAGTGQTELRSSASSASPGASTMFINNTGTGSALRCNASGASPFLYSGVLVGDSSTLRGVVGLSGSAEAVLGQSNTGVGVHGISSSADGVVGASTSAVGVRGSSGGIGPAAVYGLHGQPTLPPKTTAGVVGESKIAMGVAGFSETFGVWGQVGQPNFLPSQVFSAGVVGTGSNGTGNTKALGVVGTSASSAGVYGESGLATANPIEAAGVIGNAKDTVGVLGFSENIGVLGIVGTENNIFEPAGVVGSSKTAVGVIGTSEQANGLYGQCGALPTSFEVGPAGVYGTSKNGRGVIGVSDFQPGVYGVRVAASGKKQTGAVVGDSTTADGVVGLSTSANGVQGVGNRGGQFRGNVAQVNLYPSTAATHPASGAAGDLFVDNSKRLWFCKGGATWVRIV